MIAIITEKPSVGQQIARLVGACEKHTGYLQGGGYIVTWALGHLLQLAPPEAYGRKRGAELPLIPESFLLTKRDDTAARQLSVIRRVLDRCDSVIAATDAGREGELIFRTIYDHLGCTLPVRRLWISSLTEEAIEKGLRELREGKEYDRLYRAADCRAKTDWLVGMNASNALARISGITNSSLGRVQTPTLAMIASRTLQHRGFLPADYWNLMVTLRHGERLCKFHHVEDIRDQATAEALAAKLETCKEAKVVQVKNKRILEAQPLLYDLTTLQQECNIRYELSAAKTLEVAQALYEKKLITYPRTCSRYIPQDMMPQLPSLLRMILRMEPFAHFTEGIDPLRPARRSIDASRVTDHHALLITGNYPDELSLSERRVYKLICGRMLEAFAFTCQKDTTQVEVAIDGLLFRSHSTRMYAAGWRGVYNHPSEDEEDDAGDVSFTEGELLSIEGYNIARLQTRPQPLFTEGSLLGAMEDGGLGTPATRAAIIETLIKREYIERSGKTLQPTDRGLALYRAVKDLRIADVELTAGWERSLVEIERGEMRPETFLKAIEVFTRQVTQEVLSLDIKQPPEEPIECPKCHEGHMILRHKIAKCDNEQCGLVVRRKFLNKELTELHLRQLLTTGKTRLIKGFLGKAGKTFDACLMFDLYFNLVFRFPGKKH